MRRKKIKNKLPNRNNGVLITCVRSGDYQEIDAIITDNTHNVLIEYIVEYFIYRKKYVKEFNYHHGISFN
jgi:hypothetical protein